METPHEKSVTETIQGYCHPAFSRVRETFENNFTREQEHGAACSIYFRGEKVVDLWGGYASRDESRPWKEDTVANFYSVGKGLATLCTLQLVDQGKLALDAPVANWWPEFAEAGKGAITVRQLLCHQAGLPALRDRMADDAMYDWELITSVLAAQQPWFEPGSRHVYHTNTYGFLSGELVRRISGQTVGEYFREHIAGPLGAEVYFGLQENEIVRAAEITWLEQAEAPAGILDMPMGEEEKMIFHGYFNPPAFSSHGVVNSREWRMAEIPSTNGHGTARGIASIYNVLAHGGSFQGQEVLGEELLKEAAKVQSHGHCPVLDREVSFGLGFQVTGAGRQIGPNKNTFGHYGTGGALGFADPEARLGFGYVMNTVIPRWRNTRNQALVDAVYDSISKL